MSYNYGAKESARVRKIYLMTFEIVVGIMAVGTVICFMVPQTLMSMFTNNPETLTEGAIALRIICAGFIASSVSVVSAGAFEALGKGIQSFLISFLRYVVLIIPAAFVLSKTVGVHVYGMLSGLLKSYSCNSFYSLYPVDRNRKRKID